MKRIWPLAALGILAYIIFALVTLPATVVTSRLAPYGIVVAGVTGTAWKGNAGIVQIGATNLGSLSWDLHILPLFTLRMAADVKMSRSDGFAQGTVSAGSEQIDLRNFTASLPIAALPPQVAPGGWTGTINAKLAALTLANGWPTHADGTIEVMELTGPARQPANIGSYRVTFPAPTRAPEALTGSINDIGGPIQIVGTIQLKAADRSYLLDGMVATKPDAPSNFTRTLEYLGEPDAQGRRPFSLSGTM